MFNAVHKNVDMQNSTLKTLIWSCLKPYSKCRIWRCLESWSPALDAVLAHVLNPALDAEFDAVSNPGACPWCSIWTCVEPCSGWFPWLGGPWLGPSRASILHHMRAWIWAICHPGDSELEWGTWLPRNYQSHWPLPDGPLAGCHGHHKLPWLPWTMVDADSSSAARTVMISWHITSLLLGISGVPPKLLYLHANQGK